MRLQLWLFFGALCGLSLSVSLDRELPTLDSTLQEPLSAKFSRPFEQKATGTIYGQLSSNPRFSRLTKALDFVEDVASFLNDSLTFFAPPDEVLHRPGYENPYTDSSSAEDPFFAELIADLTAASDPVDYITRLPDAAVVFDLLDHLDSFPFSEGKHKKWRKILKFVLRAVLNYHIIPAGVYDTDDLGRNLTYPTNLRINGAFGGEALRLRATQTYLPPATKINVFRRVSEGNIGAANGVIHVVDGPLFPPPSVFQELYMYPRFFSTLTSAIQHSGLTRDVDLRWVHGKGPKGASLVTIFAPTNRAFDALPEKLRSYLFSPFGQRALKKLLKYHIVPKTVLHSNYVHTSGTGNTAELSNGLASADARSKAYYSILGMLPRGEVADKPPVEPIFSVDIDLQSLLANHTVHAHIAQNKINVPFPVKRPYIIDTKVRVNGLLVIEPDIVGLNGAIHVINKLLDPRRHRKGYHHNHHHHHHHHHHHEAHDAQGQEFSEDDDWSGWESWLIEWAMENY